MNDETLNVVLTKLLSTYFAFEESVIERLLIQPNLSTKERVGKINDLNFIIYSNDHNPPHFHVISNDQKMNAKFRISDGELLSGEINSKQLKRVKAFYLSPKTQHLLEKVWNKRYNN